MCVSADGSRLFSGSDDSTIKVWDVATGACVQTLEGHENSVSSVCVSADGSRLFSGSHDDTIKVWDIPVAQPCSSSSYSVWQTQGDYYNPPPLAKIALKQEHEPLAAYYPVPIERGPENGVAARVRRRKARAKETAASKSNALKSKIKKEKLSLIHI